MIAVAAAEAESGLFGLPSGVVTALLSFLGLLITTVVVQRVTARNARRAYELQKENEDRKNSLEQAKQWRDDTVELRKQRDEDRKEYEADRIEWRAELGQMKVEMAGLRVQVESLTSERRDAEVLISQLTTWCKVVVVLLRQHNIPYPTLPPGITDTNPRDLPAQPTS